ncbi:hypothetical protein C1Y09_31255, partial [Pseudomonas sp. FW306-02-F08-AA]
LEPLLDFDRIKFVPAFPADDLRQPFLPQDEFGDGEDAFSRQQLFRISMKRRFAGTQRVRAVGEVRPLGAGQA